MSGTDRFHEIRACQAAEAELDEFDKEHSREAEVIKQLALMLTRGGWGEVLFNEDLPPFPGQDRVPAARRPVAVAGLPAGIEDIVRKRRAIYQKWRDAYDAVPAEIKDAAHPPRGSSVTMLCDRLRRAGG